jgi:hypothetical protein
MGHSVKVEMFVIGEWRDSGANVVEYRKPFDPIGMCHHLYT